MTKGRPRLLHKGAAAIFDGENARHHLMSALLYQFTDEALLRTALTHPSASTVANNQRLEFLGDAVLQLLISQELFSSRREAEGKLTFRRQRLVNEQALARVARSIHLGDYLVLGSSFAADGGAALDSVLADAMEALIAAVYLDGGLERAAELVARLWGGEISRAGAELDAKGALQAHYQALGAGEPTYQEISQEGQPHQRVFKMGVYHSGKLLATGEGGTKRAAQQKAAALALAALSAGEAGK